jgi:NCAIR mutase (PurE)-related protein
MKKNLLKLSTLALAFLLAAAVPAKPASASFTFGSSAQEEAPAAQEAPAQEEAEVPAVQEETEVVTEEAEAPAEEAAQTAEYFGTNVERLFDVGVSGIHRLLSKVDTLQKANCVVAIAGMEGALASVIGGLVSNPVIAVPTSVGYGASFGGLSALLTMINSCANGIAVVNIDNGYGYFMARSRSEFKSRRVML